MSGLTWTKIRLTGFPEFYPEDYPKHNQRCFVEDSFGNGFEAIFNRDEWIFEINTDDYDIEPRRLVKWIPLS